MRATIPGGAAGRDRQLHSTVPDDRRYGVAAMTNDDWELMFAEQRARHKAMQGALAAALKQRRRWNRIAAGLAIVTIAGAVVVLVLSVGALHAVQRGVLW